jgi:hypothetical protein
MRPHVGVARDSRQRAGRQKARRASLTTQAGRRQWPAAAVVIVVVRDCDCLVAANKPAAARLRPLGRLCASRSAAARTPPINGIERPNVRWWPARSLASVDLGAGTGGSEHTRTRWCSLNAIPPSFSGQNRWSAAAHLTAGAC